MISSAPKAQNYTSLVRRARGERRQARRGLKVRSMEYVVTGTARQCIVRAFSPIHIILDTKPMAMPKAL